MSSEELLYVLALQHIPNLGDTLAKKLIRHLGTAKNVLKQKKQDLLKIDGIGAYRLRDFFDASHLKAAEEELKFIEKNHIKVLYFKDQDYPDKLKHCIDGPVVLFQRGNINLNNQKIISVVGTRKITQSGVAFCEKFIEELSPLNPIIVSGFAYGVDITAQKAAVANNLQNIGCLAHGLDQIYPKVHQKYMASVEENGGFFTDFWSSDDFDRNNFLKRNRIIAGLSEATVVIESAEKGGSLVTADIANSYNREVFAVPGRPSDKLSKGCNDLIKSQKAHLLNSAADLVYMLNWQPEVAAKPVQKQLFIELDAEENNVLDFLQKEGKTQLDSIALNCNFPSYKVAGILINMELKGVVRPLPGKLFELI
ncbi:DNA processing protein [Salegentibacter holothuriorum]|uniref:DNA processing protein n=1 Tax=Salegentibacter holothuriorum TaxID=241145 RepID=A0A1T5BZP8_9FLAO|nr:DNA-processing protein DprA [Salegentibacter holothuriorum]SKB52370.1 DNA processing protein [Salegentibacter holothuriorum]